MPQLVPLRSVATCLASLFLFATLAVAAPPEPPKGFRPLFNGENLEGWYGHNPHLSVKLKDEKKEENLRKQREEFPLHWKVENGELINSGTGPYATTNDEYGDIELLLEYKTVPKADSGIYLRGTPQVQIWDWNQKSDPKKPNRNAYFGSGGLFNNTPGTLGRDPLMRADRPFGEWNKVRIRQIGPRTWVTLNGQAVVMGAVMENYWDRSQPLPAKGPIMLQTHGGEIRWRNIFVRDIPAKEAESFLKSNPLIPEPTEFDVAYGPHPKQVLHFWKAESETPTPVLLFVHGGGWRAGGRLTRLSEMIHKLLAEGISVVSVEYRFTPEAEADGVIPPVKGPLHDAARALQLVRSRAKEWNLDPQRIGACGTSAGACTSLWLAFHPDLADPNSDDPIARESTRLLCAAVMGAQTTLDPQQMKEWIPNSRYGAHAFGIKEDTDKGINAFDEFLNSREKILPWIAEYSPYALVTSDDPPIYLNYAAAPALGQPEKDPTHSANFGVKLQERCREVGVPCELYYPGAKDASHTSSVDYLIEKLKSQPGK
ncbi:family 16 glycoside hydrolase [Planctomicrobium sp. SH664]|uniref:family 16 glycoside hydrolase n=1 Tax=Planctomicrobium sp. SH664 TaxID=3448125 RepID=UPI003F5BF076